MDYSDLDTEDFVPGSLGCHEVFLMALVIADLTERQLCEHPSINLNPHWKQLADDARNKMLELYTAIGQNHSESTYRKRAIDYYTNDDMDERACDYCSQSYRGPAVYCSLKCAEADA